MGLDLRTKTIEEKKKIILENKLHNFYIQCKSGEGKEENYVGQIFVTHGGNSFSVKGLDGKEMEINYAQVEKLTKLPIS